MLILLATALRFNNKESRLQYLSTQHNQQHHFSGHEHHVSVTYTKARKQSTRADSSGEPLGVHQHLSTRAPSAGKPSAPLIPTYLPACLTRKFPPAPTLVACRPSKHVSTRPLIPSRLSAPDLPPLRRSPIGLPAHRTSEAPGPAPLCRRTHMRVRARGSSGAAEQDGVLGAAAGAWRVMDRLLRYWGAWVQEVVVVLYSRSFFRASFFYLQDASREDVRLLLHFRTLRLDCYCSSWYYYYYCYYCCCYC
jgi:hypothetical protein